MKFVFPINIWQYFPDIKTNRPSSVQETAYYFVVEVCLLYYETPTNNTLGTVNGVFFKNNKP